MIKLFNAIQSGLKTAEKYSEYAHALIDVIKYASKRFGEIEPLEVEPQNTKENESIE